MDTAYGELLKSWYSYSFEAYNEDNSVMHFEHSELRPRMYRCYCRRRRESNPLFRAVLSNDMEELIQLVEGGNTVNIQNAKGSSLLNFVMRRKRVEIFDYLLSRDDIDVNFLDRLEQSPLLYLAGVCFDEYFALELIKKGADIHQTDDSGFTFLHLAAKAENDDNLKVGQLIIDNGANINAQGQYGITPLYAACEVGNFDWICMLLYYGADVTLASDRGVLPLAIISEDLPNNQKNQLEENLFNCTFDKHLTTARLPTVVAAMTQDSPLFSKILDHITDIDYNTLDLQHFVTSLIHVKAYNLKLFVDKFGYIVEELICKYPPLDILVKIAFDCGIQGLKKVLRVFLNSPYVATFVQSSLPSNSTISLLLEVLRNQELSISWREFTEMVCLMVSYGLSVTSRDLDAIYNDYGYCELFRILLHMDVVIVNSKVHSMAMLYYDPTASIDHLDLNLALCCDLIGYYNNFMIKNYILANSEDDKLVEKVKRMPNVPLLVELSRNAARKHIVDRYDIQSSMQFNTIMQWLPIGKMNKVILALEEKLY